MEHLETEAVFFLSNGYSKEEVQRKLQAQGATPAQAKMVVQRSSRALVQAQRPGGLVNLLLGVGLFAVAAFVFVASGGYVVQDAGYDNGSQVVTIPVGLYWLLAAVLIVSIERTTRGLLTLFGRRVERPDR